MALHKKIEFSRIGLNGWGGYSAEKLDTSKNAILFRPQVQVCSNSKMRVDPYDFTGA